MKKIKRPKISYEPEADVLRIEIKKSPLFDTVEMGNFIVSLDKNRKPIYVEILEAKNFLLESNSALVEKLAIPAAVA